MQTSEVGSYEQGFTYTPNSLVRGFTLIELVLVLFILALAATTILPRFNLKKGGLTSEARHLVAFISRLSTEAALKKKVIRLYYDLDKEEYWATTLREVEGLTKEFLFEDPLLKRVSIHEDIDLSEIAIRKGLKTNRGTVYTSFTPWGYRDRTYIYLKDAKDKVLTIAIPSIGERIKVYEGYVE